MKYFGTDGVRGIIGEKFTSELIIKLANAITLHKNYKKIIIGRDTRRSGDFIIATLSGILMANGIEVEHVGFVPSTALAYLTPALKADLGLMITASHNPAEYNGIKVFLANGDKLDGKELEEIDDLIDAPLKKSGSNVGTVTYNPAAIKLWQNYLIQKFKSDFKGQKLPRIALDCAFGSGGEVACNVLKKLGFDVERFNTQSNGLNINENCGAMHPEFLSKKMGKKFDIGFAFDGDADRCVVFDERGEIVAGDVVLALAAQHMKVKKLVSTVMFNSGTEKWLNALGCEVIRKPVGERYILSVLQGMPEAIGGEPNGHIVFPDIWLGSDGLATALVTLKIILKAQKKASVLYGDITVWTSILHNITKSFKAGEYWRDGCRVLIRKSGTENLTRILVEGEDNEKCNKILNEILSTS